MLTNKLLPAFHIVTRRADKVLIVFSRILKKPGETIEKTCPPIKSAPLELHIMPGILARPFQVILDTPVLAPHPSAIHPN